MAGQIKASFSNLASIEKKMSGLNTKLQNRKLVINLESSKGGVADAMKDSANQLNKVKDSLCSLTYSTEQVIKKSRTSLEDMDIELQRKMLELVQGMFGG